PPIGRAGRLARFNVRRTRCERRWPTRCVGRDDADGAAGGVGNPGPVRRPGKTSRRSSQPRYTGVARSDERERPGIREGDATAVGRPRDEQRIRDGDAPHTPPVPSSPLPPLLPTTPPPPPHP